MEIRGQEPELFVRRVAECCSDGARAGNLARHDLFPLKPGVRCQLMIIDIAQRIVLPECDEGARASLWKREGPDDGKDRHRSEGEDGNAEACWVGHRRNRDRLSIPCGARPGRML